ncbi:hypothetical protein TRFO_28981 [Tritrichomonas foetus]|uniref:Uncharacterized protein n=1 Tax=Tritrichomonas foetus TaxID=1144522 RepID=A0A1J4JYQ4_9EUKA|nr:hypothetical protein TRFO_28981 [Tritrichomonas foetus]|eukprot:OHT03608.1 hypothetical protein TRFO_28981 [Tritrichomonas foetus]
MKTTKNPQQQDLEISELFCLNALKMLGSIYLIHNQVQQDPFPIIEGDAVPESKHAFQSRVVDLKLRRQTEKNSEVQKEFNSNLADQNDMYSEYYNQEEIMNINIDDAFAPQAVERPQNYKYLSHAQKDSVVQKKPANNKGINMKKITKEYQARLNQAKEKGINRAKRRAEKMQKGYPCYYGDQNAPSGDNYYQRSEDSRNF